VTPYQATDEALSYTDDYGAWFNKGGIGGTIQNPLLRLNEDGSIVSRDGSFVIHPDGTAETLRNGSYIKTETVGTYLGYGGANTPRYVIMVRVAAPNKNLEGGLHAGPIFTDMSNWMIDYMKIAPEVQ
jgi:hypothetical protein